MLELLDRFVQIFGQNVTIRNCYNIGDIVIMGNMEEERIRLGSLVGWYTSETLIDNNHCFIFEDLKWFGEFVGEDKGLLGENYKNDTNEINEGYPILNWQ